MNGLKKRHVIYPDFKIVTSCSIHVVEHGNMSSLLNMTDGIE